MYEELDKNVDVLVVKHNLYLIFIFFILTLTYTIFLFFPGSYKLLNFFMKIKYFVSSEFRLV